MSMFVDNQWSLSGLMMLIRKNDDTGKQSAPGSGRPCTAHVADKIDEVDDLVLRRKYPQISATDCPSDRHLYACAIVYFEAASISSFREDQNQSFA